jgi:uncharacterized membrane protein YgdD (TMEM256/DUF423 family)
VRLLMQELQIGGTRAHAAPNTGLDSASQMLLLHALAVLAGSALLHLGLASRPLLLIAIIAWILGAFLFSGDIALRAFAGHRLFPMAAPIGGTVLIAAWLALAAAAIAALVRTS